MLADIPPHDADELLSRPGLARGSPATRINHVLAYVALPFLPLGRQLKLEPIPGTFFLWLTAILLSYSALTQVVKGWYIRRFDAWL